MLSSRGSVKMLAALRLCMLFLCVAVLPFCGCAGGGSEGTGVGQSYRSVEGRVIYSDGSPVAGAQITLLETGENATSNQAGSFEIHTLSAADSFELEIESAGQSVRTRLESLGQNPQGIQVTIKFDPTQQVVPVEALEVSAKIVGQCDIFFENRRAIRQANPLPQGTRCTLKVVASSGGTPIGNIPYGVRYRGCKESDRSTEMAVGLTSAVFNPGVGQVQFPYFDDSEHCVYEVIVPYKVKDRKPIVYQILTFTKQSYDGAGN
jgi:hypothetical protein